MSVSAELGKWLVVGCIGVYLLLDLVLLVLGWTLLAKPEPLSHAVRMASTALVGFCLYRGHSWARWLTIVISAATVVYGAVLGRAIIEGTVAHNPFSLLALLNVLAAGLTALLLLTSPPVKEFLKSQRASCQGRP
jgi:ABC-type Co2+ transport system permease subunit